MVYTIDQVQRENVNINKGRCTRQIFVSLLASLSFFTHGIISTALTSSAHSGHFLSTPADVPWSTTALILGALLTAPLFCYMADRAGRRMGVYIISLVQGTSCIPLLLPPSYLNSLVLHALAGVSSAGIFTVLPIYICEINSVRNRGLMTSLLLVMTTAGYLLKLTKAPEATMFLVVALVVIQILMMVFIIESPAYFVMVEKLERAADNLAKFRGLNTKELYVKEHLGALQQESERATARGRLTLWTILRNEIWRDATKLGIVLDTTQVLCGSVLFLDQSKALAQLQLPDATDHTLVLLSLFGGSALYLLLVKFFERKYLVSAGYMVMVLSMGTLAVFSQAELTVTSRRWLPVASLAVLVVAYGFVWAQATLIAVEICNFQIRASIVGLLFTYYQLIKLAHVHTIRYIDDYVGTYTLLYIFTCVNLYGGVYSLFAIPRINNRTVKQIERQLRRVPLLQFKTIDTRL